MSKYQINYSRVAPDHRVPFDYVFVKKTQNPWVYLKVFFYQRSISKTESTHHLSSFITCILHHSGSSLPQDLLFIPSEMVVPMKLSEIKLTSIQLSSNFNSNF